MQDIVSCSALAQGCEGGFPYLIAGRWGGGGTAGQVRQGPWGGGGGVQPVHRQRHRLLHPPLPQVGVGGRHGPRHYTESYGYVGGYYGGCSEEAMMQVALGLG